MMKSSKKQAWMPFTIFAVVPVLALGTFSRPTTAGEPQARSKSAADSTATSVAPVMLTSTTRALPAPARQLQEALGLVKDRLNLDTLPQVDSAKQNLADTLKNLEAFIIVDSPNGQAWSDFLQLDLLKEQLDAKPSSAALAELESNMRQNYNGLELTQFTKLRAAIAEYRNALRYGNAGQRTLDFIEGSSNQILKSLEQSETLEQEQTTTLTALLAMMEDSNQAPEARQAIAEAFRSPNLELHVDEAFINTLLGRSVAQPRDVNECLLGTRIIGTACLAGNVSVDLSPMNDGVSLAINLQGTMTTNNRGYNRGVILHSTGYSPIFASKQIWATRDHIAASPASIQSDLRTRINAIEHRLKIVRRIAKKKAAEQKPKADAIARGRLSRRVANGYDEEVDGQIANANTNLQKLKQPLPAVQRLDIARPTFSLASSSRTVFASATQAADTQLAAPAPCPLPMPSPYGLCFRVHQSLPVNVLDSLLIDRVIRSHQLDNYVRQFSDEVPDDVIAESNKEKWEVHFRNYRPIDIAFEGGKISITMSTAKLLGQKSVDRPAKITAIYTPLVDSGTVTLVRDGDLNIQLGSSGTQDVALRSVVRKKFDEIFKSELPLPLDKLQEQYPRTAGLTIQSVDCDAGWLQIVLR